MCKAILTMVSSLNYDIALHFCHPPIENHHAFRRENMVSLGDRAAAVVMVETKYKTRECADKFGCSLIVEDYIPPPPPPPPPTDFWGTPIKSVNS